MDYARETDRPSDRGLLLHGVSTDSKGTMNLDKVLPLLLDLTEYGYVMGQK